MWHKVLYICTPVLSTIFSHFMQLFCLSNCLHFFSNKMLSCAFQNVKPTTEHNDLKFTQVILIYITNNSLIFICRRKCVFSRLLACENHFNFHHQNGHSNNLYISYGRQMWRSQKQMIRAKQTYVNTLESTSLSTLGMLLRIFAIYFQ